MHVAGSVSWSNGVAHLDLPLPATETGLLPSYGSGDYTLIYQDITVTLDSNGDWSGAFTGRVTSGYTNLNFSGGLTLHYDLPTQLSTFTGADLYSNFNATFTAKSGYTYTLNLFDAEDTSEPIQAYTTYTSGTDVVLSDASINTLKSRYPDASTITVGANLLSYKNGTLVGTSSMLTVESKATKGVHLKVNGTWKEAVVSIKINGSWKEATPYSRINGQWKEGI